MRKTFAGWSGAVLLAGIAAAACADGVTLPAPNISKTVPADPMTLLSPKNRHDFVAIDLKWKKVVRWMEPAPGKIENSFFERDEDPHKPGTQRYERYFDGDSTDPEAYRKFLIFAADGKMSAETDRDAGKTWQRCWYADGSFASYTYNTTPKTFGAAVAVRSDRQAVSVYDGGTGAWLRWYSGGKGLEYQYWTGDAGLIQATFDTHGKQLDLQVDGGFLAITPTMEWLTPPHRDEGWNLTKDSLSAAVPTWVGQPAEKPGALPPDKIHQAVEAQSHTNRLGWGNMPALTREQYDTRRAEFIAAYTARLKEHNQTWESLGIATIRDHAMAELPAPDPAWLAAPIPTLAPRDP